MLGLSASAQSLQDVLKTVGEHNLSLKAARSRAEAEKLEARTGLNPSNPELELGYLWGDSPQTGNRIDIAFNQSFDFPSVYYWKRRLSDRECSLAEYNYRMEYQSVMLEASQVYYDLIYHNCLERELGKIYDNAKALMEAWESLESSGSVSKMDLQKVRLEVLRAKSAYEENRTLHELAKSELKRIAGGMDIDVVMDSFEQVLLPDDFESWFAEASERNPQLLSIREEVELAASQTKLQTADNLPKFSLGYASERILGTTLQGIKGSISIPLWENKGRVKAARARELSAKAEQRDAASRCYNSLKATYSNALRMKALAGEYETLLADACGPALALAALQGGEISMVDYIQETSQWYEAYVAALGNERDLRNLVSILECFNL